MPVCVPIKELKNGAEFARTVREADGPVIVTRNGYEELVAMTPERYEALRMEAARAGLYQAIDKGEADIAAGRTVEAHDLISQIRQHHGL